MAGLICDRAVRSFRKDLSLSHKAGVVDKLIENYVRKLAFDRRASPNWEYMKMMRKNVRQRWIPGYLKYMNRKVEEIRQIKEKQ